MGRAVIRLGDATSHGGKVITASARMTIDGIPVALWGDRCSCPIDGHDTCVICEGEPEAIFDERPVALEGHKTDCGATLIASQLLRCNVSPLTRSAPGISASSAGKVDLPGYASSLAAETQVQLLAPLTESKIQIIRKLIAYEKINGTHKTAARFSSSNPLNGFADNPDSGSMGPFENQRNVNGTPTAIGIVDLDWFTDLAMVSIHPNHLVPGKPGGFSAGESPAARSDYAGLKSLWQGLNGRKPGLYKDPTEGPAVWAVAHGYQYCDLFPEWVIEKHGVR